jgi:glycosyltransferase involved in cell wall biosynthesis
MLRCVVRRLLDRIAAAHWLRFSAIRGGLRCLDRAARAARPAGRTDGPRSVLFIHHAYYNFYYLAQALRRRGWDAVSASLEGPDSPNAVYYHGEDVTLYDPDPDAFRRRLESFYDGIPSRFRMVHFYGMGHMSFFPWRMDARGEWTTVPYDFLSLRLKGVKIGYSASGCLDGAAQASVFRWSRGACDKCVWRERSDVCSDERNLAWGRKVHLFCDLVATEGLPALDYQQGPRCVREPLTTALDAEVWRPDLPIPERYRLPRAPGEMIVYHGVGNYDARTRNGRNLKGSSAVLEAIERLRREGVPVRLEFVTHVPNRDVRFIQAQADVIVDQLNFGRYGATAREGMMLGKPTICCLNRDEDRDGAALASVAECPLVNATEDTVYDVLKDLLGDEAKRRAIGARSRRYALKWHSADACAERFERVYDRLMEGRPLTAA